MFQIDNSTAVSAQPPSTPAGAAGFFTDGSPASNLAATIVPAEFLNSVMMELVNAVTSSGQPLNKAAFNQLWTAMQTIAKNPGVTPPQFDNTTKTATTQFVQRALGNYQSGVVTAGGTINITSAQVGGFWDIYSNATVTAPPANSVPLGSALSFSVGTGAAVFNCSGSDNFYFNDSTPNASTYTPPPGIAFRLVAISSTQWFVAIEGVGKKSLVSSGYQTLASGLMVQWGYTGASVVGGSNVTFPTTFPHSLFMVALAAPTIGAAIIPVIPTTNQNTSSFPFALFNLSGTSIAGTGTNYIAMGN
ncbi:hypothetical protein [Paraburkholderia sp. EG304]|uniref:gp53-like domain-containing protein n=1 Tax=Paraburkholderia sp. EG304 TaxID=3237015 RepID=UPI00397C18A7